MSRQRQDQVPDPGGHEALHRGRESAHLRLQSGAEGFGSIFLT